MITALMLVSFQRLLNENELEVTALDGYRALMPNAKSGSKVKKIDDNGPFNSAEFLFNELSICVNRNTNEIVTITGRMSSPRDSSIISEETALDKAKIIAKLLRPKLFAQLSFEPIVYDGSFGVGIGRSINGVAVLRNGDSRFITFDKNKGYLQGFVLPPTEAGIHKIEKWLPESKANSTAVRFALDTFKGPTQLNFDSVKKTYVGENWFRGMPNPNHRAFTDPRLKNFLFPAYVVRYLDADSIRPSDQVAMQLIDVFVDAENNSIFGYIIWSAGGGGAPAKPLDGESFTTIKILNRPDQAVTLTMSSSQSGGSPTGISATLFSPKKVIKVLVDQQSKLIWRGKQAYKANEEFWRAVSK